MKIKHWRSMIKVTQTDHKENFLRVITESSDIIMGWAVMEIFKVRLISETLRDRRPFVRNSRI